jgi:hypothetical protein
MIAASGPVVCFTYLSLHVQREVFMNTIQMSVNKFKYFSSESHGSAVYPEKYYSSKYKEVCASYKAVESFPNISGVVNCRTILLLNSILHYLSSAEYKTRPDLGLFPLSIKRLGTNVHNIRRRRPQQLPPRLINRRRRQIQF